MENTEAIEILIISIVPLKNYEMNKLNKID